MTLTAIPFLLFCLSLMLIAILYGSVGLSGASGFVALMALYDLPADTIKPLALLLNVLVSAMVSFRFYRAGHFSWPLLWPFLILGVPAAFAGGYATLPEQVFNPLLALMLWAASFPLLFRPDIKPGSAHPPPYSFAIVIGGLIGLASGLTGMGGGVLLAPVMLHCRWATATQTAAVSGMFIFFNSVAALLGHSLNAEQLPVQWPWFALAAVLGGFMGSHLGSRVFSPNTIRRLLGIILIGAGFVLL